LETDRQVNFSLVARVARRVDLRAIRLTEINASSGSTVTGTLEAALDHDCDARKLDLNQLEVSCRYRFTVRSGEVTAATVSFTYAISYDLKGEEPVSEEELSEFAFANGTYHSWPFVRQLLFDLTARMGYPPFSLPVFKFNPKPPTPPNTEVIKAEIPPNAPAPPSAPPSSAPQE
jgi:preprotein translocase subunit SecB